jgi:hypothetical protein
MGYRRDASHIQMCVLSRLRASNRPKLNLEESEEAVMMLAYRLVRLIETHSDALAAGLLHRVQHSELTREVNQRVPPEELKQRVYEIYRHLGEWLLGKTAFDIEQRYEEIGMRRAHQGVPISELIWTIVLTKENLWEFLKKEALLERPAEIFGELEMLQLLEQFFERATYYAAVGYERAAVSMREAPHPASAE